MDANCSPKVFRRSPNSRERVDKQSNVVATLARIMRKTITKQLPNRGETVAKSMHQPWTPVGLAWGGIPHGQTPNQPWIHGGVEALRGREVVSEQKPMEVVLSFKPMEAGQKIQNLKNSSFLTSPSPGTPKIAFYASRRVDQCKNHQK